MPPEFWIAATNVGLAVTLLLYALVTGSKGNWHFDSAVQRMVKGYEDRLQEYKDRLAEKQVLLDRAMTLAETNGKTADEALEVAKTSKEALARIEVELQKERRESREGSSRARTKTGTGSTGQ